jgi:hypothetical protein
MGASILWKPIGQGRSLGVSAPSSFWESLTDALDQIGDELPIGQDDIPIIRGLRANHKLAEMRKPYDEMIEAIEKHGTIIVFRQF